MTPPGLCFLTGTSVFVQMLYDNGQLASTYLDAFCLTGKASYARVARGILDYLRRDMTHPDGGIFSAEAGFYLPCAVPFNSAPSGTEPSYQLIACKCRGVCWVVHQHAEHRQSEAGLTVFSSHSNETLTCARTLWEGCILQGEGQIA